MNPRVLLVGFPIPGRPVGKERPRSGRNGHFYTPSRSRIYERGVRDAWLLAVGELGLALGDLKHYKGVVRMSLSLHLPIAASWPKWRRVAALEGDIDCHAKPDHDNVAKAVSDALNGLAYVDDRQVVPGKGRKVWVRPEDARAEVVLEYLSGVLCAEGVPVFAPRLVTATGRWAEWGDEVPAKRLKLAALRGRSRNGLTGLEPTLVLSTEPPQK